MRRQKSQNSDYSSDFHLSLPYLSYFRNQRKLHSFVQTLSNFATAYSQRRAPSSKDSKKSGERNLLLVTAWKNKHKVRSTLAGYTMRIRKCCIGYQTMRTEGKHTIWIRTLDCADWRGKHCDSCENTRCHNVPNNLSHQPAGNHFRYRFTKATSKVSFRTIGCNQHSTEFNYRTHHTIPFEICLCCANDSVKSRFSPSQLTDKIKSLCMITLSHPFMNNRMK